MRKIPSLKALQAFEAAARRGSFAAAADELHVTASAISHQIRFLEQEVGVSLFHRNTRTIALTDVGENFFQSISEAFITIEAATRDIERHGKSDILTVHAVPSFAAQWLMPRLARFSAQHSSIDVRLYASADPVDLNAGLVDVDIRYGSVLPIRGVVTLPLPEEAIMPFCSPDFIARTPHHLRQPSDLCQCTLIHSEVNLLSWRGWAKRHDNVPLDFDRGPRFDRSFMAISAAVDGLGVCLESHLLVERELQTGRLVPLFEDKRSMVACHSLSTLKAKQNVPKIKAFEKWILNELARSQYKQFAEGKAGLPPLA
ncbi:transcriptional regulator GcvA [Rhizobium sp. CFBP 8762]|uniref:transcriptional regulator GcvA n=1 Tax=Rhizobium sp. CFBP 8762 TaxID=2775279 RepID=UPI00177C8621|nr:transcriptional regulator GcvA [Rhizobium sp. CFBP 8762]MBD8554529.1 transcriptional regulator GcvA [Rhizobium sp. CFBP 8762]